MALERVNPIDREDRFCVDHLHRYAWASPLCEGKAVLDIACGLGFGAMQVVLAGARAVTGVDVDADTVERCREWWEDERLRFACAPITGLGDLGLAPVDRILCFETLEHVEDPGAAVAALKAQLQPDGLLIGSVPGELDWAEENPYHLQFFNAVRLRSLLEASFGEVRLLRQRFLVAAEIGDVEAAPGRPLTERAIAGLEIDFGRDPGWVDTYVFLASDAPLPATPGPALAFSRRAWLRGFEEARLAQRELQALSARYRQLFFAHGDLQRRFDNMLGWGRYHYARAEGKEPELSAVEAVEQAQSRRERELSEALRTTQAELQEVRARLAECEAALGKESVARREALKQPR